MQTKSYTRENIIIQEITSKRVHDITNKIFNKWHVIGYAGLSHDKKSAWWVYCECNPDIIYKLIGTELVKHKTKSCGCNIAIANKERELSKDIIRLHRIFYGMRNRCNNIFSKDYHAYGQRGIKICDEWINDINDFVTWSFKNGYKENLSIDRKDVNGNYEPNNCRWITLEEQNRNKTTTIYVTYNEERRTLLSVINELGLRKDYLTYVHRIKNFKWDIIKTLETPIKRKTDIKQLIKNLDYEFKLSNIIYKKDFIYKYGYNRTTFYQLLKKNTVNKYLIDNNITNTKEGKLIHDK